jgi:hypothetical protein
MRITSGHVVLLGDSIFDNQRYTCGQPDVATHLRSLLPPKWLATLRAVDGTTTADVSQQFSEIPVDGTHLVLSLGGNDAIMNSDVLDTPLHSSSEALLLFADRLDRFEASYRNVVDSLAALGRNLQICTIYNGALPPAQARMANVALMTFNDVILRVAFQHQANVIDLRLICTDPADYANPIEPSGIGGLKIAQAIGRAVGALPGAQFSRVSAG